MRNTYCRNWIMERKLKNVENQKHTVGHEICRETLKNLKNDEYTLQDLDYGEKTEKPEKLEMHNVRLQIQREN